MTSTSVPPVLDDRSTPPTPPTPRRGTAAGPARGVNLLSPWVLEELRVQRLRRQLLRVLVALLVVAAGAWGLQQLRLSAARSDLEGEIAVGDGLRLQIDALAPVTSYAGDVRRRADTVRDTMATQLDHAATLGALQDAVPDGARLETLSLALPLAPTDADATATGAPALSPEELEATRGLVASCPGPDPFATRPVVSCLLLGGTAPDRAAVTDLVRALGRDPLFVEPFVDTTTTADGVVTFSGSVGLSPAAFTGGYDDVEPAPEAAR